MRDLQTAIYYGTTVGVVVGGEEKRGEDGVDATNVLEKRFKVLDSRTSLN